MNNMHNAFLKDIDTRYFNSVLIIKSYYDVDDTSQQYIKGAKRIIEIRFFRSSFFLKTRDFIK